MPESVVVLAEELKAKVLAFATIAKACPENLQEKCFEVLLRHYLDSLIDPRVAAQPVAAPSLVSPEPAPAAAPLSQGQEDIARSDVHLKALKFLERYGLTMEDVNEIFYKEGDQILPLYEDLKTTKISECQIRIALLHAFRAATETGDFIFDGETVRAECQVRKCYDQANFAAHFRNNAELFDGFDKYDSSSPKVKLSEKGRQALAELIKELR